MAATTQSQKRVAGEQPEDLNINPSNLQKEFVKLAQKNKNKKVKSVRQGDALEQTAAVDNDVPALPFVNVQPLPVVGRGQTKLKSDLADKDNVEKLLGVPDLLVELGFKNRAPLQLDEQPKDLIQEALKNTICIITEDLLNVSKPMMQELKKLLMKKHLEKKSVSLAAEVNSVEDASEILETISAE